jgi:protein-L-isoaspartate(D-aspartate) O-methyltransferase
MQAEAFWREREQMVREQILARAIRDPLVLEAMRAVPRHCFIAPEYHDLAYADGPLPIGLGQTISQPYIVALMSELLELKGVEKVLEVGTGSGYQAAILAHLAKEVHTIERHANLARLAQRTLRDLGLVNVSVHVGDGSCGLIDFAPFDGILVTAAAPRVPQALLDQLADGGRLALPVGKRSGQVLERWVRTGDHFEPEEVLPVAFVPLIGKFGWEK